MISNRKNRLDPSLLDNEEREELKQLVRMLSTTGHPALVDEAGLYDSTLPAEDQ